MLTLAQMGAIAAVVLLAAALLAAKVTASGPKYMGTLRIAAYTRLLQVPHLSSVLTLVLYLTVGNLFYTANESRPGCPPPPSDIYSYADPPPAQDCTWTQTDALYFQMVSMSTVGYGDLVPSSPLSQVFTVFYILFGIIFVFTGLAALMATAFAPVAASIRFLLERACPVQAAGAEEPPAAWLYYAKGLLPEMLVVVGVQVGAAEGFVMIEGWDYWSATYHCLITATTVGYGSDISTQAGRQWATLHIALSVALLGALIGSVDALRQGRALQLRKWQALQRELDVGLIDALDKNGDGVDKLEFVLGMLTQLGYVSEEDIQPFLSRFDEIDADGSGKLTHNDLAAMVKATREGVGYAQASQHARSTPTKTPPTSPSFLQGLKTFFPPSRKASKDAMRKEVAPSDML